MGAARRVAVAVWLLMPLLVIDFPGSAQASAGPNLSLEPASGPTGAVVEIRGQYFGTACNDLSTNDHPSKKVLGNPAKNIAVVIAQDNRVVPLITIDADDDYMFAVRLSIPSELHEGPAAIRVESPHNDGRTFTITSRGVDATATPTVVLGRLSSASSSSASRWQNWLWASLAMLGVVALIVGTVIVTRSNATRRKAST